MIEISVVVPAFNEEAEIKMCLDSLLKQDLDRNLFEVIVVDNASTDKTKDIIKSYPFKYVYEAKRSVVLARQKGVDRSSGKIIVSADADTKYPKGWLSQIKSNFDKNKNLIGLVGWIYYRGASPFFNILVGLSQEINLFISRRQNRFPLVYAANFAFKKVALRKIGGYPKHLPELGDQQYLLKRFQKLGKVTIDPKVKCFTSNRQLKKPGQNIIVYNGWHRLIGYPLNFIFEKEVVGPKPPVRRAIRSQRSHS